MSEVLTVNVHVTAPEDTTFKIDVDPEAPIYELKKKIEKESKLHHKQQRLLLSGMFLSDHDQLSRYKWDVDPEPVIHVVTGDAWDINTSATSLKRPAGKSGAGTETKEQKMNDLMVVASNKPEQPNKMLSEFNERLFPMLIPTTIPRFRKMLEMLPRSIVHQEIMRRLFLPDNLDPSRVEECTERLCTPAFRKAFDTLCQLEDINQDDAEEAEAGHKAALETFGKHETDIDGNEPDPRLKTIIEHLKLEFFQDVNFDEEAENEAGASSAERAIGGGDANAFDMLNDDALDDRTLSRIFQSDQSLHEKYATQLSFLEDMGYKDATQNLLVLEAQDGDIEASLEFLIAE